MRRPVDIVPDRPVGVGRLARRARREARKWACAASPGHPRRGARLPRGRRLRGMRRGRHRRRPARRRAGGRGRGARLAARRRGHGRAALPDARGWAQPSGRVRDRRPAAQRPRRERVRGCPQGAVRRGRDERPRPPGSTPAGGRPGPGGARALGRPSAPARRPLLRARRAACGAGRRDGARPRRARRRQRARACAAPSLRQAPVGARPGQGDAPPADAGGGAPRAGSASSARYSARAANVALIWCVRPLRNSSR
jgi:hypothetical protein